MNSKFEEDSNQQGSSHNVIYYQDQYKRKPTALTRSTNAFPEKRQVLSSKHAENSGAQNEIDQDLLIEKLNQLAATNQIPHIYENFLVYLIADTNVLLSNLTAFQNLTILAKFYGFKIVMPREVTRELDLLKTSSKIDEQGKNIGLAARKVIKWMFDEFSANSSVIRGQKVDEVLDDQTLNDDSIYDCLMFFKSKLPKTGLKDIPLRGLIVLLSNDKNLCIRALNDSILTITFTQTATSEFFAKAIYDEACSREEAIRDRLPEANTLLTNNIDSMEYINDFISNNDSARSMERLQNHYNHKFNNPYLLDESSKDSKKIFLDLFNHIGNLAKSMIGRYIKCLSADSQLDLNQVKTLNTIFYGNTSLSRSLYEIVEAIKSFWDTLRFGHLLALNTALNSIDDPLLSFLSTYSKMVIVRNVKDNKIHLSIMDAGGKMTKIPTSQERFLYEVPDTTFKLKKFQIFWSIIMCKITCILIATSNYSDTIQEASMDKLVQLWDEVIQFLVTKNNILVDEISYH